MKTLRKVLLVALTGMFLAGSVPAFAQYPTSMQEKTGNWLSGSTTPATNGGGGGPQGISSPTPDPTVPVGDSLLVIVLLAGGYLVWRKRRELRTKS